MYLGSLCLNLFTSCPKAFYRSIYHIKLKQQWTLKTSLWQNIFSRIRTSKVRKGERLSLYWNIVAVPAQDYPVFLHMKWLDASSFPSGWGVSPSQGYPLPPLKQLLLLGGERETLWELSILPMNWPGQVSNMYPQPGVQLTNHNAKVSSRSKV